MANKIVSLRLTDYSGTSGLVLGLLAQGASTFSNGSGDTLTPAAYGIFTATVTEAITGWFDVLVLSGDGEILADGGLLYIDSDTAGTYYVDDPELSAQATSSLTTTTSSSLGTGEVGDTVSLCDVVSALMDRAMAVDSETRSVRLLTVAVQDALRDITQKHKWKYYTQTVRFNATASQTVSVTYTESTRTMTIDGDDTWPTDAIYGEILYDDVLYSVATRTSDTVLILDASTPVGADFEGEVVWQRSRYTFNRDFASIHYLINLSTKQILRMMTQGDLHEQRHLMSMAGDPSVFTHRGSNVIGATDVVLMPSPSEAATFESLATVIPTTPKVYKISASDGTITSGQNLFSSASSRFTASCVGAVLRLYNDADDIPHGEPTWEALISEVVNSTSVRLSSTASATVSSGIFVVSSVVDIEPSVMLTYLKNEAFANYCQNTDHKGLAQAKALAKESLLRAIAADNKVSISRGLEYNRLAGVKLSDYARVITN